MKKKKFSRQLLSGMLAFSLGFTSMTNIALANDKKDSEWKKVDKEIPLDRLHKVNPNLKETNHSAKDEVRTLIVLDGKSAAECGYLKKSAVNSILLNNHMNKLETQQEAMSEKISDEVLGGENLDVRYNFTVLANAMSANVTYEDVEKIREVDGVKDVYVLPQHSPQLVEDANPNTITSGEMVGSYNTWQLGYSGEGMRIAIIDTGLDMDHPSFNGEAFEKALSEKAVEEGKNVSDYDLLDKEDIINVLDKLNATAMYAENTKGGKATADDFYRNTKVPFAFSYIDQDMDVTHDKDTQGDHGTHVAGISTANKYVKTEDGFAKQKDGVVGIAPNAQLFVMKVFGNNGGAYTDDYMAAIQDALLLDVDAINLSLGSASGGESVETYEAEAYVNEIMESLEKTNTVVSISAGNAGAWSDYSTLGGLKPEDVSLHTVGSPGSYTNSFTVASADNVGATGYTFDIGDKQFFYTESNDYGNEPFASLDTNGKGTEIEYVFIDGIGVEEDYEGIDVTGKVVFVSRGETSFFEKHIIAAEHGAVACVIYNNQPGIIGLNLTGTTTTIPCVSIKQVEGMAIKEASTQQGNAYVGKMTVYSEITSYYDTNANVVMSDFSSWGVSGDLSLKPEITAPGGNIYSTLDKGQYGLMSGTSMAAPSVAGMSALVIQYIEDLKLDEKTGLSSRVLAQSLLMSTANIVEEDGIPYSPRKQGAGLADVENAVTTPVTILMGADGKVKAELGDDPARTGEYSFTFTLVNLTDEKQYYSFDSKVMSEQLVDGLVVGSSTLLHPTVEFTNTTLDYDLNNDGKVDKLDAMIFLKHVNKSEECPLITENESKYDFNQDGTLTTLDVHIYLTKIENDEFTNRFIVVDDKTEVTVTIKLSEEDKAYLDTTFVNGMYVDGFVTLDGNIDLSIPFLAYYGDWNDPSMFEHISPLDGNEGDFAYTEPNLVGNTNIFVDGDDYFIGGNPFVDDEEYIEDRNAISSDFGYVASAYYSLIRNAQKIVLTATNALTGEVYKRIDDGEQLAAFFHDNAGAWMNIQSGSDFDWDVTDADGNPLPEGTKVNLSVSAYTAHNVESEKAGKGTSFTTTLTVDNTEPEVKQVEANEDGSYSIVAKDNGYLSCIFVLDREMNILGAVPVNQTERAVEMTVDLEFGKGVYYIAAADYAGNISVYEKRINNTGEEDTEIATDLLMNPKEMTLLEGESSIIEVYALPETLINTQVTWESSDPKVATVKNGVVTGVSAGSAIIIATTVALDASGQHIQKQCEVTVKEIDCTLGGLVVDWNEMTSNWSQFTARNPQDVDTYVENNWFNSATNWGPYILGCDLDTSDLLVVDPKTYQTLGTLIHLGDAGLTFTDMAEGGTTGYLVATMENYLFWLNLQTGDLIPLDFGYYVGGDMNGITYVGNSVEDGELCETYVVTTTNNEAYLVLFGVEANQPRFFNKIADIPSEDLIDLVLSSLYYDQSTNTVFYSACVEETWATAFYAIDVKKGEVKYLSTGDEGVSYYGLLDPNRVGHGPFDYNGISLEKQEITSDITVQHLKVNSNILKGGKD